MEERVRVAVRIRPLGSPSTSDSRAFWEEEGEVASECGEGGGRFAFDAVYGEETTQDAMYAGEGERVVGTVLERYNACVFAYGQTGSGKTHTMTGAGKGVQAGLIPRIAGSLGDALAGESGAAIEVSYLEIYKESISDLLAPGAKNLKLRESPSLGVYVQGLSSLTVTSAETFIRVLEVGDAARSVAATGMNAVSSRSHAVVILSLLRGDGSTSRLNLVDLAGSERQANTRASGSRLQEACAINKSLSALANVISALASKKAFVPYRNSVLTRLLQGSLGGNASTLMIAAISPKPSHREETLSTLRYAQRAKRIKNSVSKNTTGRKDQIAALKAEVAALKSALKENGGGGGSSSRRSDRESDGRIEEELKAREEEIERLGRSLQERTAESEALLANRVKVLEDSCISLAELSVLSGESSVPAFLNLMPDHSHSQALVYYIRNKEDVLFGSNEGAVDIVLRGPSVCGVHMAFSVPGLLIPDPDEVGARVYVNGKEVVDEVGLEHGDRIIVGTSLVLMYVDPAANEAPPAFSWTDALEEMAVILGVSPSGPGKAIVEATNMVQGANALARKGGRPVVFSVEVEASSGVGIRGTASAGSPYGPASCVYGIEEFRERLDAMMEADGGLVVGDGDPFVEMPPDVLFGTGVLSLSKLLGMSRGSSPLLLRPVRPDVLNPSAKLYVDVFLMDPESEMRICKRHFPGTQVEDWIGRDVAVVVAVKKATGFRVPCSGVFVRYDFPEGDDVVESTPRAEGRGVVRWGYVDVFCLRVGEGFVEYLEGTDIEFEVFGFPKV